MYFNLSEKEIKLLENQKIAYDPEHDYADDEALELLDRVREAEAYYSQGTDKKTEQIYFEFCNLGDKIFDMIPEE